MSSSTYFVQECPTCGRRLRIRVEYLGKQVVCQHCAGQFTASDPATSRYSPSDSAIMRRANELLQSSAQSTAQSRVSHPR
jgi:rRNA maturation protein Nop10